MKSRRDSILIVTIVTLYVLAHLVAIIVYFKVQEKQASVMYASIATFIKSDIFFENEYGKVVSVEANKKIRREKIDEHTLRVPCIVRVESGIQYTVFVDYYSDHDKVNITYHSIL